MILREGCEGRRNPQRVRDDALRRAPAQLVENDTALATRA